MSSVSIYNTVPTLHHSRSQQDLSHIVKTSMNVGTLYPVDVQEIYPGDTMKVQTNVVSRLSSTFLKPVMDNLFLDVYHFFVPSRILYNKWQNIFGQNDESAWANTVEYRVPTLPSAVSFRVCSAKTVGNYLGLPVGELSPNIPINILPFRAFAKIYEDWFRDENNVLPMHIQTGEHSVASEILSELPWSPSNYFGKCPKVAKLHDYFTSALPSPQKGVASSVPVTSVSDIPVRITGSDPVLSGNPLKLWIDGNGIGSPHYLTVESAAPGGSGAVARMSIDPSSLTTSDPRSIVGTNLAVNLASARFGFGVSDLREAVQYQRMLERDARGGTRYIEYLRSAFGVTSPDARLQRSEFLGGRRMPISITQVTQSTGANSDSSPLGEVGGFSLSGGKTYYNKGFVEHGYVITVACIRQFHTYQQGVEKFWTRQKRIDFYDPVFSTISEQPVYSSEIYAFGEANGVRRIFGYQEAWSDLRSRPNRISGQMVSNIGNSLDVWHFGDQYSSAPVLGSEFIEETPEFVDRTISVPSESQDQFILDFYIKNRAYRVMPVRSVPGLVDHH